MGNGLFIIINQGRRENIPNIINSLKLFKLLFPFLCLGYSYVTIIAFVIIGSRGRTFKSPENDDDVDTDYDYYDDQDAKKVSFTACHSGKL